ncbi:YbaB/EbfC family nucleoid-associated protein [Nonomuraea sp. NPDC005983]|uniref:YbaB/EbfC family nucleoid-associated protein n=1 Tax=Nonomuraea sp. NPDC005983 TaxID=3155595 RepID=UPI0033AB0164
MTSPFEALRGSGDEELDRLLNQFQGEITELEQLQGRIAAIRGRGEAAQGRVTAEVSQTGALAGLTLDARAMRLGSEELAEAILQAAGEAVRDAEQQTQELMTPFIAGTLLDSPLPPSQGER